METISWIIQSTTPVIKNAVVSYFKPILWLFSSEDDDIETDRISDSIKKKNKTISAISAAVYYNQGAFVQYYFLASEKHRALKEFMQRNDWDRDEIKQLTGELISFLNRELFTSVFENFKLLHAYFAGRHVLEPRICIKGAFRSEDKNTIISVVRDRQVSYISDADIRSNTGFDTIKKTGMYFLLNNIPEAARRGTYRNPRLNISTVQKLHSQYFRIGRGRSLIQDTEPWLECWKDYNDTGKDITSFYKSTLIIPMVLKDSNLSDTFKSLVNIHNADRTIFGFLCFDHADVDYFNEEDDVKVGYVYAELFSLYLFARAVFTEISRTFSEAEKYLDSENLIHSLLEQLGCSIHDLNSTSKLSKIISPKREETRNNKLFQLDETLLDCARIMSEISNNISPQARASTDKD
jgi:hypothetical protein